MHKTPADVRRRRVVHLCAVTTAAPMTICDLGIECVLTGITGEHEHQDPAFSLPLLLCLWMRDLPSTAEYLKLSYCTPASAACRGHHDLACVR